MPTPHILTLDEIKPWFAPRNQEAHKGVFGHVLIVGGDYGMPGAVRLVAEGAARIGAGLVTVVTRKAHVSAVVSNRPEVLCYGVESSLAILDSLLSRSTVVALGSGLGQSDWSARLFHHIIQTSLPIIVDADGLNGLAKMSPPIFREHWILTPHPGEASRLLNTTTQTIQSNREQHAKALQQRFGGVVVLKGAGTLITSKDFICRCDAGNPGMATGGMGDLLTGMIAGLVAQGFNTLQAAQAGVLLHALAGDRARDQWGERGLLATDLLPQLRELLFHPAF